MRIALVAAAIIVRAVWIAGRIHGGWQIIGNHFVAGLPLLVRNSNPDGENPGVLNSSWLLEQADRMQADPNASAVECMGAALSFAQFFDRSLPEPQTIGRILWCGKPPPEPPNTNAGNQSVDMFTAIQSRSRDLTARATQIEPERQDWWRLRAVLMSFYWGASWTANAESQLDTTMLDDCAFHDPDNSLYEYLAGSYFWNRSWARPAAAADGWFQTIADFDSFRKAVDYYRRAFAKKFLAIGAVGSTAVVPFLDRADVPLTVKFQFLEPNRFNYLRSSAFQSLWQPIRIAVAEHMNKNDFRGVLRLLKNADACWIEQADAAAESTSGFGRAVLGYEVAYIAGGPLRRRA